MKALVYRGPGKMALEDHPRPDLAVATSMIVQIQKTTLCGADLHILKRDVPTCEPGRILGHEDVGAVEKVGVGVRAWKMGRPRDRPPASRHAACANLAVRICTPITGPAAA